MEIKTYPIGSYQTNCYFVCQVGHADCVLIDPGFEPAFLLDILKETGKNLAAIFLTHGHSDHLGAAKAIAEQTGCKVYLCKDDLKLTGQMLTDNNFITDYFRDKQVLELAGLRFQVLHTPGHTPGSVCLLCQDVIFSGDTLFAGTCGRTDLPGGSHRTILASLARLAALPGDYRVLPGHGRATTLETERNYNPFICL